MTQHMHRSTDRILTTHAGALPRPDELIAAIGGGAGAEPAKDGGAGLDALLRRLVPEVVRRQVDAGIDVVNDGEYGKPSWTGYVTQRLAGFEARPATGPGTLARSYDMATFDAYYEEARRKGTLWHTTVAQEAPPPTPVEWVCSGPITYAGHAVLRRDIENLGAALRAVTAEQAPAGEVPGVARGNLQSSPSDSPPLPRRERGPGGEVPEGFLPVAAPASVEVGRKNEYYATEEEYVFALAEAMREEYRTIVEAGFIVQIDDAWIPALWDQMLPNADLAEYLRYCDLRAEALNHALRDIPPEMVRYHVCWGSWHGPHVSDIPLQDILPLVLKINAGAYVIEAANVRHEHEYHLWDTAKLPEGKLLVPGVVSHATNVVEHPELVAERVERFASRVGRENVLAGTDCGLGGRVHPQVAWAKLRALVEGAALASRRLWP
jgi:5-methyltetrahydropteroyltriglutamate--homocysteine methyltransferase